LGASTFAYAAAAVVVVVVAVAVADVAIVVGDAVALAVSRIGIDRHRSSPGPDVTAVVADGAAALALDPALATLASADILAAVLASDALMVVVLAVAAPRLAPALLPPTSRKLRCLCESLACVARTRSASDKSTLAVAVTAGAPSSPPTRARLCG
jgi:hypothetical protein